MPVPNKFTKCAICGMVIPVSETFNQTEKLTKSMEAKNYTVLTTCRLCSVEVIKNLRKENNFLIVNITEMKK